jgi:hypothetical protein
VKRISSFAAVLLILVGCRPDTVELGYRFVPGRELTYRLVASARAFWDIGGTARGSYRVIFDVVEKVGSVDADGAILSVEMTPIDVEEVLLPSPGAEQRSFALLAGLDGQVIDVLQVDGIEARDLEPDQLLFIGTYRPPLPADPVSLSDRWSSQQELGGRSIFQQIETHGTLESLNRDEEGDYAELSYDGDGPLVWTTTLPQGAAELTGSTHTQTSAIFDLDGGFLRSAQSSTTGNFEVRVVPEGGDAPIRGTLRLELDLELERNS